MKILFSIKEMDKGKGGAERVLADLTSALVSRGHDISLVSFDKPGGNSFYPLNDKVRRITLGIGKSDRPATFFETILRIIAMRKVIRAERPDAVVAFMHSTFIPMAVAGAGIPIPLIASEHIVPDHYLSRRLEMLLFCISSLFIKKITVLSGAIREDYPSFIKRKMVVMPNPVRIPAEMARLHTQPGERKIILNVGRLSLQKDQETLIRAFAKLADGNPHWSVRIVGDGDLRDRLSRLIEQTGLNGRVELVAAHRDIESEYRNADIFALPSRYESFGLATAEAMSYGVPPIGFADCPGTNELIDHGVSGLLVEGEDRVLAFAGSLRGLMDSAERRKKLGNAARISIRKYAPDAIVDRWEALIQGTIS